LSVGNAQLKKRNLPQDLSTIHSGT